MCAITSRAVAPRVLLGIIRCSLLPLIHYSIFRLLPLGAGLMRGVYVTVRVRISRTWRTFGAPPDFGDLMSMYLDLLWQLQSYGERAPLALRALNGECTIDDAERGALNGDSPAEKAGDGGMRRRPSQDVERAVEGMAKVVGGPTVLGDLWLSQLHEQLLSSLESEAGAEVGEGLGDFSAAGIGLAMDLRNSV